METKSDLPFYVSKDKLNETDILSILEEYGLACIGNYLDTQGIEKLHNEFTRILEFEGNWVKKLDYSLGRGTIVYRNKMDSLLFPHTFEVFSSSWMLNLTRNYLGENVGLNTEIYVVNDVVGSKHHANDLHFDVTPTFKFFIYLTDTSEENGAFACVPGSHKLTADIRTKYGTQISYENRHLTRRQSFKDEEIIPIEGKAGTLIIFDTDVFHQAGTVHRGERKVMRGHSRIQSDEPLVTKSRNNIFRKIAQRLHF